VPFPLLDEVSVERAELEEEVDSGVALLEGEHIGDSGDGLLGVVAEANQDEAG
jgi:hypothetical protein